MSEISNGKKRRCVATIWCRDTLRYTGRGKSGFSMHYNRKQCSRAAESNVRFCSQHQRMEERGRNLLTTEWHEFVEP